MFWDQFCSTRHCTLLVPGSALQRSLSVHHSQGLVLALAAVLLVAATGGFIGGAVASMRLLMAADRNDARTRASLLGAHGGKARTPLQKTSCLCRYEYA